MEEVCRNCGTDVTIPPGKSWVVCPNCRLVVRSSTARRDSTSFYNTNLNGTSSLQRPSSGNISRPNLSKPNDRANNSVVMVKCKWCKEAVPKNTVKCPHCGEYQSDSYKTQEKKNSFNQFTMGDEHLTAIEWIVICCCPCIGFVGGAVYHLAGNSKSETVFKYSAIAFGVWTFIGKLLNVLNSI